ncbi:hypothetical protein ES332_A10G008200v1 [Gossypium tomentosum]|uniref:non-specific serine/threonine protein kinase n=1 Tax=Gossypium tomentosum TaxID=34277 RepID=A0A5D2NKS4_GOSTO|nr:hypothetical protein ES332_A10G008200v1 [Gossypium tomentosum]
MNAWTLVLVSFPPICTLQFIHTCYVRVYILREYALRKVRIYVLLTLWRRIMKGNFLFPLTLLLCFLFLEQNTGLFVYALNSDGETLFSLLPHWSSLPSSLTSSWNASDPNPCKWVGVECDSETHNVLTLNLTNLAISGQLPPQIGALHHLNTLDLSNNRFFGPIPSALANCSSLQHLDLSNNELIGPMPNTFNSLQKLNYLNLFSNSLSGEIPETLFHVTGLVSVYLNNNNLSGSIPMNVGNLSELVALDLYDNGLIGTIPESIGNCSKLQELFLDGNYFVGGLPSSVMNLQNLMYLYLSHNSFNGEIPSPTKCKNLSVLDLSFNSFNGGIPPGLANCSTLTELVIVHSNLTGYIPSSLGLLDQLSKLDLSENHLYGEIPFQLGKCKSLKQLLLYDNQLKGEIPNELGMLSELNDLELFMNHLSGEIPISIWRIPSLEYLLVYKNNLTGELPLEITEFKQLKNISLYDNGFFGVIPRNLGINASLQQLDFTNNMFSGTIPPFLCFGKKLRVLNLGQNQLTGSVTDDIGGCKTLWRLILKQNNLNGVLPEFAENKNLVHMDISENDISGPIPSSLGNCRNLTSINLSMNRFTGFIPSELSNLADLQTLNVSHNLLQGSLPSQLSNCSRLVEFDVGFNSLNGLIPNALTSWKQLSTLILSENRFTGGIPSFLLELEMLSDLQLGGNPFGGSIPSSIGAMKNLIYGLNLSSNSLTGEIPSELRNLFKLVRLDLSNNNLTGTLTVLDGMDSLVEVNVSYNHFTGPIPTTMMRFMNLSSSSFLGNPGLCIDCLSSGEETCPTRNYLNPCNEMKNQRGLTKLEVAMIALGSSLLVVALLVVASIFIFCRIKKQEHEVCVEEGASNLLNKVMEATENLNERYIIGRGAHGVVYRASLSPGSDFAVKRINVAKHKGGNQSMVREIETIGKVKHRNLVRLEDFWLRKDYGLLLYRYMQNGSLHDVLHNNNDHTTNEVQILKWSARYRIALGTAHGLEYLHYDCDPGIVHRDIKPENILLDSDMEPHISDFGIAKLLDESVASEPSMVVAGTVGYIAPENAFRTTWSKEADVYSYGVVLLELITGKRALDPSFMGETDIVGWVRSVLSGEIETEIERIVDSRIVDELMEWEVREQVINVVLVALRCTEKEPSRRPAMRDVVRQLLNTKLPRKSKHRS